MLCAMKQIQNKFLCMYKKKKKKKKKLLIEVTVNFNAKVISLAKKKVSPVKQQEFSLKKKMARRNNFQNSKIKPVHAFSLSDKCIFITVY